jgi:PemK-like, MazF-like toxin of type II toxin-antitoxin system
VPSASRARNTSAAHSNDESRGRDPDARGKARASLEKSSRPKHANKCRVCPHRARARCLNGAKSTSLISIHGVASKSARRGPVLVVQAQALIDAGHPSTIIVPLTTNLIEDAEPLRIRVSARQSFRRDSDRLIEANQLYGFDRAAGLRPKSRRAERANNASRKISLLSRELARIQTALLHYQA